MTAATCGGRRETVSGRLSARVEPPDHAWSRRSFANKPVAIERSVHALRIPAVSRSCWGLPNLVAR